MAPAKTPREIVNRLHDEVVKALATPEVKERFADLGRRRLDAQARAVRRLHQGRDQDQRRAGEGRRPAKSTSNSTADQGPHHGHPTTRNHHARRHRTHGHEPAPDPLHRRDPQPGRRDALQRRQGHARPDPDRPQRREDGGPGPAPGRSSAGAPTSTRRWQNKDDTVFFDAGTTQMRPTLLAKAIRAGKHVYCEKPIATNLNEAVEIARLAEKSGLKHGAVQDKLFLPGLRKLDMLRRAGFFGRMLSRAAGVRLLGVRRRPAADPASQLELPQGRRRRDDPGHDVPLALRAGQPVRRSQVGLLHRRHPHSAALGRSRASPTPPPPTTRPTPRPNWSATTASR